MRFRSAVAALALVVGACGCTDGTHAQVSAPDAASTAVTADAGPEPDAVVMPSVIFGTSRVTVSLARTSEEQRRGLMYVQHLPPEAGMLFIFPRDAVQSFWMHNTLIPLDMIFIRADLSVAGIVANAEPLTDTPRNVGEKSRYVLEVNGGWAAAHGVVKDSLARFEGFTP